MEDVAPILLEQIKELYNQERTKNALIEVIHAKIKGKQATYIEAEQYANELGGILAKAYKETFVNLPDGKMYYNIAKRTVEPTMVGMHTDIADITDEVQTILNEQAGLGINPIRPELEQNKIDGILNRLAHAESFEDIKWILDEPIKTFARSTVNDAIKANAEFHAKAGMSPKIVRKMAGDCCDWCKAVAGTYIYPEVPRDIYRRHQRCRCTVDYIVGKRKQNVWNKAWSDEVEPEKIEQRKAVAYGEKAIDLNIESENTKVLQLTPEEKTQNAIMEGYEKRRIVDNLNLVPLSELKEMKDDVFGVKLGNLDIEIKDAISTQIEKLSSKYKSTLQRISVASKEDMFFNQNSYGWNAFNQQMYSSEITIAPYKKDKLIEKMQKTVEYGWCTYVNEEDYLKYTATHEFGHTLLNVKAGTKNFVNADENIIKESQRKIKKIYGEYKEEVQAIKSRLSALETEMNDADIEKVLDAMEKYDKERDVLNTVLISEYSLEDVDEFFAEAFTQNEIGVYKSKYTERVMEVIKQNFMW